MNCLLVAIVAAIFIGFSDPFSCYICNSLIDHDCIESLYSSSKLKESLQKHVFWCKNLTTALPNAVRILNDVTNTTADQYRPSCLVLWLKHYEPIDKHNDTRVTEKVAVRNCAYVRKKEFQQPNDYLSGNICNAEITKTFKRLNCVVESCIQCFESLCNAGAPNQLKMVTVLIVAAFYTL